MAEVVLEAADTMLGQLQRGRGAGYLMALSAPQRQARAALKECIAHDARWDHQVEDRVGYYADLAVAVGLDTTWIVDHVLDHWEAEDISDDDAGWLAAPILAQLAGLGDRPALTCLTGLGRAGPPERVADIVWLLMDRNGEALSPELRDIVTNRHPDDAGLATFMREIAWRRWLADGPPGWIAADSRLSRAFITSTAGSSAPPPDAATVPIEVALGSPTIRAQHLVARRSAADLEALRSSAASGAGRRKALEVLALQGDPLAPALVEAAIEDPDNRVRGMGRIAAGRLHGPEALKAARRWAAMGPAADLARQALDVIGNSGDVSDIATVRGLALAYTNAHDMYAICTSAEALHALRDTGSLPWFRDLFVSTQYSYLRKRCAKALADLDADFPATLATECLWDCEPEAREVGCQRALIGLDIVGTRVVELAENERESDSVREAARVAVARRP